MTIQSQIMALPEADRLAAAMEAIDDLCGSARVDELAARYRLSGQQAQVLAILASAAPGFVSVKMIAASVWGYDLPETFIVNIRVRIYQLRKVLPEGVKIIAAYNRGYALEGEV